MRDISGWFEHQDLKPLEAEVLRRREVLAADETPTAIDSMRAHESGYILNRTA